VIGRGRRRELRRREGEGGLAAGSVCGVLGKRAFCSSVGVSWPMGLALKAFRVWLLAFNMNIRCLRFIVESFVGTVDVTSFPEVPSLAFVEETCLLN
jgi:hypothetical protein